MLYFRDKCQVGAGRIKASQTTAQLTKAALASSSHYDCSGLAGWRGIFIDQFCSLPVVDVPHLMHRSRRFLRPWTADDTEACFIVRDHNAQLAHVYFEDEPSRRTAAKLFARDVARRVAANLALQRKSQTQYWNISTALAFKMLCVCVLF